jgi:protein TonB
MILLAGYPSHKTTLQVFDVDLVEPFESRKLPTLNKKKPDIRQRKPALIEKRTRPPEKDAKPDKMFGGGSRVPLKSTDNIKDIERAGNSAEKSSKKEPDKKPETAADRENLSADRDKGTMLVPNSSDKNSKKEPDKKPETVADRENLSADRDKGTRLLPNSSLFDRNIIEKFARRGTPLQKGLSFDTSEFKHRGYMKMLKGRIEDIWKYPKEAARRGISGDLYVSFTIRRDGKLEEIEIVRTSGHSFLDEAVMKAIRKAEPFWPLPKDWEGDTLEIKGHFIYVYGNAYAM